MVAALRRRRGTKSTRQGICGLGIGGGTGVGGHSIIVAMVVAMALITLGLVIGVALGMGSSGTPSEVVINPSDGSLISSSPGRKSISQFMRAGEKRVTDVARKALGVTTTMTTRGAAAKRAAGIPPPSPPSQTGSGPLVLTGLSMPLRKQAFLAHEPQIRTQGPFPYYPDDLIDQNHDFTTFKPLGGSRFEEWKFGDSPYAYEVGESDELARSRRYHIKKAMEFAWSGYETYAFGMDEIRPATMSGANAWGGFGTTLVDSLDTLWLMGMKEEFGRARDWVKNSLDNNRHHMVSFFEMTIRSLGGLLSGTLPPPPPREGILPFSDSCLRSSFWVVLLLLLPLSIYSL